MSDHMMASESEQMYIVTTAMLVEAGTEEPVPLSALAQELSILPVSVNQMARKLEEAGLASYQPYKGLQLTGQGWDLARRILRNRRLWEVFLVERLRLPMDEAESLACHIEHVTTGEVAERLSEHLGGPHLSPKGKPIPIIEHSYDYTSLPLNTLKANQNARVVQVNAGSGVRTFLTGDGVVAGVILTVLAVGSAGDQLIDVEGRLLHLSSQVAALILVETEPNPSAQAIVNDLQSEAGLM